MPSPFVSELRALQQDVDVALAALDAPAGPARAVLERTLRANLVEFDLALITYSRRCGPDEVFDAPEYRVSTPFPSLVLC